jgi:hypothetical protein
MGQTTAIPELPAPLRDPQPPGRAAAFLGLGTRGRTWEVGDFASGGTN